LPPPPVTFVVFSPDGQTLASASYNMTVKFRGVRKALAS
jgi:hypothetical protein